VIGRLFGRKPADDPQRAADRLITSRDASPSREAIANDARIDAAVEAAVDTVALSPTAAAAPATPASQSTAPATSSTAAAVPSTAPVAPSTAPVNPSTAPGAPDLSIADAFDLLLAEEQGEAPAIYGGSYGLSEADLDRIAARVVDRLSRGPLNDTVTRIVTEVSERLVREEIARMRDAAGVTADPGGGQQ
jgi:hypothetical protein